MNFTVSVIYKENLRVIAKKKTSPEHEKKRKRVRQGIRSNEKKPKNGYKGKVSNLI